MGIAGRAPRIGGVCYIRSDTASSANDRSHRRSAASRDDRARYNCPNAYSPTDCHDSSDRSTNRNPGSAQARRNSRYWILDHEPARP